MYAYDGVVASMSTSCKRRRRFRRKARGAGMPGAPAPCSLLRQIRVTRTDARGYIPLASPDSDCGSEMESVSRCEQRSRDMGPRLLGASCRFWKCNMRCMSTWSPARPHGPSTGLYTNLDLAPTYILSTCGLPISLPNCPGGEGVTLGEIYLCVSVHFPINVHDTGI
jgi:hypothetical protein